jgi:hypothetical protein
MSEKNSKYRASLCAYTWSDGRRCRSLRHSSESKFCLPHDRKSRHLKETDSTAHMIYDPMNNGAVPASGLAFSLVRLFASVAEGRIDPKTATALARIAETLRKTIPDSTNEYLLAFKHNGDWSEFIRDFYNAHNGDDPAEQSNSSPFTPTSSTPPPQGASKLPFPPDDPGDSELPKTAAEFAKKVGL